MHFIGSQLSWAYLKVNEQLKISVLLFLNKFTFIFFKKKVFILLEYIFFLYRMKKMAVPFENQTSKNLHNNYSSLYTDMEIKDG